MPEIEEATPLAPKNISEPRKRVCVIKAKASGLHYKTRVLKHSSHCYLNIGQQFWHSGRAHVSNCRHWI